MFFTGSELEVEEGVILVDLELNIVERIWLCDFRSKLIVIVKQVACCVWAGWWSVVVYLSMYYFMDAMIE